MPQDVKFALRTLARSPGFSLIAVATLALGIGANTAIFSVVQAVLLEPMPYERPHELVRIWGSYQQGGIVVPRGNVSPLDALDWRSRSRTLASIAFLTMSRATLTGAGSPARLRVGSSSANLLQTLGVRPVLGSDFPTDSETAGANRFVLLTHGLWQRRFGSNPGVLGTAIILDGNPYTVLGVLPRQFRSPAPTALGEPDLWRPLVVPREPGARGGHFVSAVARLRRGTSRGSAAKEMSQIAAQLTREHPETNTGWSFFLQDLQPAAAGDRRPTLLVLACGVGCLLIIACANIAGLLVGRGMVRRREFGIRRALGATTARLVRQMLAESLVLSAAGGGLGVLLSLWLCKLLEPLGIAEPGSAFASLEPIVLLFVVGLSLASGLAFGLAPALEVSRFEPQTALKDASGTTGSSSSRLRQSLVVVEVGLAVLLLSVAGLFARSLHVLLGEDPGFRTAGVVTFTVLLPRGRYPTPEKAALFHRELDERLAALPGIQAVGAINDLPLSGGYSCDSFALADRPAPPAGTEPCAEARIVSGQYHGALGIPLREGRLFNAEDRAGAPGVALVNETFARAWWPGRSAVGQRLKWGDRTTKSDWLTVVGVVGDVRHFGLGEPARPEIDTPFEQNTVNVMSVVLRTRSGAPALAASLRAAVAALDKDLPVDDIGTIEDALDRSVARPATRSRLTAAFALAALLLAALGVFGTVAFAVARSTREIGIRIALGAGRSHILGRVISIGLRPVVLGAALGLAAALAAGRIVAGLLYHVPATDPAVFLSVPLLLTAVATLAAYLPARRAAAISPLEAMRQE